MGKRAMLTKRTPKTAGFTIVETLIVLAVAGLILLMILKAIPTLQRNARNDQRKQDVQAILDAVSHYELNNSGSMPQPPPNPDFLQYTKLTYYDKTTVQYNPPTPPTSGSTGIFVYAYGDWTSAPSTVPGITNLDIVEVYNHEKCDPNTTGNGTRTGAGYSDVVALYAIQTAVGPAPKCQQL